MRTKTLKTPDFRERLNMYYKGIVNISEWNDEQCAEVYAEVLQSEISVTMMFPQTKCPACSYSAHPWSFVIKTYENGKTIHRQRLYHCPSCGASINLTDEQYSEVQAIIDILKTK